MKNFKYLVGTKVLIQNSNNEFLIIKRSSSADSNPNLWDFPGGIIDEDDNPNETIVREVLEETNLQCANYKLFGVTKFLRINDTTLCLMYSAFVKDYENVRLSYEHSDYEWVKGSDLLSYKLQPWLIEFISNNQDYIK